jgi:hypothetical protein
VDEELLMRNDGRVRATDYFMRFSLAKYICCLVLFPFAVLAGPTGSNDCAAFKAQLQHTYGFRPSQLSAAAQESKTQEMDAVWRGVSKSRSLAACLKLALAEPTEDTFFLFDGSQLLVSVDRSREAKESLLQASARVSLDDVDLRSWVATASMLGLEGLDTSVLGKSWLAYPNAGYSLPDHGGYQVDRGNGAMFIFGALDERFATPALVDICRNASGGAKEIAAWLLMSQATPDALTAVARLNTSGLSDGALASRKALMEQPDLIAPREHPRTTRAEFLKAFSALVSGNKELFNRLVETVPDGERDLVSVSTPEDLDLIRRVRRYLIAKNNQHAIEEYNQFSQIIMTLVWKRSLVSPDGQVSTSIAP